MDPDDLFAVFDYTPSEGDKKSQRNQEKTQKGAKDVEEGESENQQKKSDPSRKRSPEEVSAPSSKRLKIDPSTSAPPTLSSLSSSSAAKDTKSSSSSENQTKKEEEEDDDDIDGQEHEELLKACLHEVGYPKSFGEEQIAQHKKEMKENAKIERKPAREYPFILDPFQQASVQCLEFGDSVLVSAHTSAGKTVVAEYAIALSLREKQRVIYTSPIKALSNQKYRELSETFGDVGLMTGDITINAAASCLVMTTEILRSMLYRGSEMMREIGWVIFDEIHYMRDKERGVVWEETIILLPDKVKYVFLSATIPNAREFADWIAELHNQPCHVVYTDFRPTPLQHYIFPSGGDGLFLVVDERGRFREGNFQKALSSLSPSGGNDVQPAALGQQVVQRKKKRKNGPSDCYKIVKMIIDRNYQPVIIFSFSKKECEALALQTSKLDLNSEEEKELVENVFRNAIDSLSEDDQALPQVVHILPLLKRGIGIHHSGLLPILKEVIEILFQEGLIKALFATETFAMGLNMPAKTVVFTSVRKFDGRDFRWVTGGEYIQMSGRAGRRGLDDRGIVILMVDEKMEPDVAKSILQGQADPLHSQFHLTYSMLLNLLRMEGIDPEYLIRRSFHQFQTIRKLPSNKEDLEELIKEKDSIVVERESEVAQYHQIRLQQEKAETEMREFLTTPAYILPFLQPGRLVSIKDGETDWGWGVVVSFSSVNQKDEKTKSPENSKASNYIVDVLLRLTPNSKTSEPQPAVGNSSKDVEARVLPVLLPLVHKIGALRVHLPHDLRSVDHRKSVLRSLNEVNRRYKGDIPQLDPVEDMSIDDRAFVKCVRKLEGLEDRLSKNSLLKWKNLQQNFELYSKKRSLEDKIKKLRKEVRKGSETIMRDELKCMKRVLRRLGYVNSDNVIEVKGRVACEVNASDELLLTEMIFTGLYSDISPQQIAALLSCFVFQERSESNVDLKDALQEPFVRMKDIARRIAKVSNESRLPVNEEEYVKQFTPSLMKVVYEWSNGAKFIDICKLTDVFEGSIIRAMRRLEELLRQMSSAAKAIGNSELEEKFATSILSIKRDIVFAASLYL